MPDVKKVKRKDVLDFLFNKESESNKIVVLFESTQEKNKFSNKIESEIKDSQGFVLDRTRPFRVTNSIVELNDKKVVLGIKHHEESLINHYENEEIAYYEEGQD